MDVLPAMFKPSSRYERASINDVQNAISFICAHPEIFETPVEPSYALYEGMRILFEVMASALV